MGQSVIVQALQQPVTTLLSLLLIAVFALIQQRHVGYEHVGMSYQRLAVEKELWRAVAAQLSHIEVLHLLFNLSALWSIGIAEKTIGFAYYIRQTSLLFLLCPVICMMLYHLAIHVGRKESYRHVTAVGYSCVLFGWMAVLAVQRPGGISMLPLFGVGNIPAWLSPFLSLIFTSIVIPRASFVGHLSGILAGFLICICTPLLDMIPTVWIAGAPLVFAVATSVDYVMNRRDLMEELDIPLLNWLLGGPPGSSGSSREMPDLEAMPRGRTLGSINQ